MRYDGGCEKLTGVVHFEPMARSNKDEESDTSSSVGNARPSEKEDSRRAASRYMVNEYHFGCEGS